MSRLVRGQESGDSAFFHAEPHSKKLVTSKAPLCQSSGAKRVVIGPYKNSRFWAIWIDDELLAVTVYRKGARAMLAYLGLESLAVELKRPKKTGRWRVD
jgi:hypothetical protein